MPSRPATEGETLSVTTTLELYEFGVEVTVAAPPKRSIRDGAPILAALRKALPQPNGAASVPPSPRPGAAVPVPSLSAKPPAVSAESGGG